MIINLVKKGKTLNRVKQWPVPNARLMKKKDFNEDSLKKYLQNLSDGLIDDYLSKPSPTIKLIPLNAN